MPLIDKEKRKEYNRMRYLKSKCEHNKRNPQKEYKFNSHSVKY